jgi:glycosyltransferase involved in cell wall biosynthesis
VVLTIHDVSSLAKTYNSSLTSYLVYKIADLILTHNQFSKDEILKIDFSLNKYIHIVPHGNYLPFINVFEDQKRSREYLGLPTEKKILLFFGMIKEVKGLDILLQSFKKLIDVNPNAVLLIAGKPWKTDFSFYQDIIDKNKLNEHVILHTRFIPHSDVEYYYSASDLVVLPYKKIYQSGVLMMTLSYGRPALVSDLPAIKEVVTDNENAFLFKSEDVDDLAIKLKIILFDKENLERVRKNGRALMQKSFSWHEIGRLTKKVYQNL